MRSWIGKSALSFLFLLCSFPGGARADNRDRVPPAPTRYDMLLLPSDVERVSRFEEVKMVPKDLMTGANGVLNFALPRGAVILTLNGEDIDAKEFAQEKKMSSFKGMYAFQVKGLGDDAYEGPAQKGNLYVLSFQKKHHWVTLSSGLSRRDGRPYLSMEQLKELARVILQRL